MDLNHRYISDLSGMLIDGQVNKAFREPVNTSTTLILLDPDGKIGFDTQSPSDGALYADRMIRIVYSVYSELLPRWVDVPLFCGPVTQVARDDALVSVECQGKESLYREPSMAWEAKTYYKGTLLTSAIRDILGTKGGETKFDLPGWATRLARDFSMKTETPMWDVVKWIVGSDLVKQVFYDGRGVLRLRSTVPTVTHTFTESHLLSVPKLSYNMERVRNAVIVKGGTPAGKNQIIAIRHLQPPSDPNSSTSLGRTGWTRELAEVVDDPSIMTQAAGNARAQEVLQSLWIGITEFEFESVPIPHLEPGDATHLTTRDASIVIPAHNFSVPLKAGNPQTNGSNRRISSNKARIRRR